MGWFDFVDGYCERLDAELFAEPVNLLSNGGFLVVAYWLWPRAQPGSGARTLVILVAAIRHFFTALRNAGRRLWM